MNKHTLISFLLLVFATVKLAAQPYQLTLSINVNPPYSADYTDYFSSLNQITLSIVNSSPNELSIYLAGSVSTIDGGIYVRTSEEERWPGDALVIPAGPSSTQLTGVNLQPFVENSNVDYGGIAPEDIVSGLLPEGEYRVCLRAYDYDNLIPVSADHCSNTFTISYPPPPALNTPSCESFIERTAPQNILFSWQTPLGIPAGTQPSYIFTLVQLPDGIDAQSALENTADPIYEYETPSTSLSYGIAQPLLQTGRTYAWRVKVYDTNNEIEFQNEGYSEPCTFSYIEPGSSGGAFTLVYPLSNDTIPWTHTPIIHRFDPYSDDYYRYTHQFELRRNGAPFDTYDADNDWPNGPQQDQNSFFPGITQEQSQHLSLYKSMDRGALPFNSGEVYDWNVDIQLYRSPSSLITGSLEGEFVNGMGKPRPVAPMNNDSVMKNLPVTLRFKTSAPPSRIIPPYSIIQTNSENPRISTFNGGIDERWLLEVSRTADFDSVIASRTKRIGQGLSYDYNTCREQCLLDSLYRDETFQITPSDTGYYYWRVRWMLDPTSTSGPSYHDGPTWRFLVKDTLLAPEAEQPTPGECVNTCEGPTIYDSDRVPIDSLVVGDTVSIGMFTMRITEITWSGSSASGRGNIYVPFMLAPMKVSFSNILINSRRRVYEGNAVGIYDNAGIIPPGLAQGVAQFTSMSTSEAQAVTNFINTANRLVSMGDPNEPMGLPIGIDQETEGVRTTIGIVGLKFTPRSASLNAMVSLDVPGTHGWLSLGANDICFHPDGIGGDGRAMLYLPLDHVIPFGDSISLRFNRTRFSDDFRSVLDSGTFVSWDCRGFRSLSIDGAVVFGRDMLVEDRPDGSEGMSQIEAQFTAKVRRRNQWLARINFNHPFQVKGVPGWGFEVEEAWLDFADSENPDGFSFPMGYAYDTTLYNPGGTAFADFDPSLYWKGFYLKRQSIRLPSEFRTYSNPSNRMAFSVNDMLIDRSGLSASFRIENLFEVTDGNLNGWGFSMDTLLVDVVQNSFSRGGFVGEIQIPISDSALVYSSMIRQNLVTRNFSYELRVLPKDTIEADLWAAKLALHPTSYIQATIDSGGVFARAELTGNMSINAQLDGIGNINFTFMSFEQLGFQTRAPYIDCSSCLRMGFASPQKWIGGSEESEESETEENENGDMSGFPVSIRDIGLTMRDGASGMRAGIQFTLSLNLTGESNTFSAATTLAVMGRLNLGGGSQQVWEFDSIELDSIGVSGRVGVVSIAGYLRFYNGDATYGNGFKGMVQATFEPTIAVQVVAQFGEKSGFRYWMVDAQAVFTPGITLISGLDIFGFGGGAWYHMRRTSPALSAAALENTTGDENDPPGLTLSGVTYVPDENIALGFQATVVFGSNGTGEAYNADVSFSAQFTRSGGIDQMSLTGNGYFMCNIKDRSEPQVHASVSITYDFARDIFDARFAVTINVAGGVLRGVNPGGLAGQVQIYASPVTWFVHAGTPTTPIGLNVADIFSIQAYLMVGENLPAALPPDANVLSIITPETIVRHPGLANGDGFAFGARTNFDTGRLGFMPFYARLNMGMGFDISLLNFGPDVFCEGSAPGETIGVDGWYADGQAYAYIGMDIGIYVDIWVASGEFSIIKASMAALLQVGLPNPSWVQGTCGGTYSILNGLVKGNCQFQFKIGEECRPAMESALASIDILEDLVPMNGEQNVDCGINPEASFNAEVETQFDLEEITSDGSSRMRRFRFVIERFELKKGTTLIQTRRTISSDKFKASLVPNAFLDPFTNYSVTIRIRGEEYNFTTATWAPALKRDGSLIFAEQTNTFKTGAYPDRIPDDNVAYSYPFNTQRFFLQGECNEGIVKLKATMDPLFVTNPTSSTIRKFNVRFIPIDGGPEQNSSLVYNSGNITFSIPTLLNNKVYACQVISKDSSILALGSLGAGIVSSSISSSLITNQLAAVSTAQLSLLTQTFSTLSAGVQTRSNRIDGRSVRKNEKLLYVFFFKTSQHNTLVQKMQTHTATTTGVETFGSITWLEPKYTGGEKYDLFDVKGTSYMFGSSQVKIKPLVHFADPRSGYWNTAYTQPAIYDLYSAFRNGSYTTLKLLRPTPDTIGVPPRWTIKFDTDYIPTNGLAPSEFLPLSTAPNSVFSNLTNTMITTTTAISTTSAIGSFGGFTAPSSVHLNVETGLRTYFDYQRMVTISNSVIVNYGHPQTSEYYTPTVRTKFLQFLSYGWRSIYRGTYQFNYFFRPPGVQCLDIDDFTVEDNRKPYTY